MEDPVEYHIEGITQGHIRPEAGFTFERGIRGILRQDPDVAMIGEMRDKQTACVAIEAALSGHLVLSTLHTNDAPSTIMRLIDMGIEPFLVNAAVSGVLAQRLARKICNNCKHQVSPNQEEQNVLQKLGLSLDTLYKGSGCVECLNLGYKGRTGIFELLVMNNALRSSVMQRPLYDDLHEHACKSGMQTLLQDGEQKLREGIISLEELVRAVR